MEARRKWESDKDLAKRAYSEWMKNNEEEKIEVIITILRSKTKPANEALETNKESPGFYKQII